MITYEDYSVADPDALETPSMLLFQDTMDDNIREALIYSVSGYNTDRYSKLHGALGNASTNAR